MSGIEKRILKFRAWDKKNSKWLLGYNECAEIAQAIRDKMKES